MPRTHRLALLFGLALLITLAGCSALGGPTVSEPRVVITDTNQPAILFNYSVDDYATVLLEGPSGQVINENRLEPDKNVDGLLMGEPQPGTYKLIVQQGGETIAQKELKFEGADPVVEAVVVGWSKNNIERVYVEMRNDGDLPVRIEQGTYAARGQTVESDTVHEWIPANDTKTIELASSYSDTITITEPGTVNGRVSIATSNRTVSSTFTKSFDGASMEIADLYATWDRNSLTSVVVSLENTGDLPGETSVHVEHAGETLASSETKRVSIDGQTRIKLAPYDGLYHADSGGNVSFDIVVDTPSGTITRTKTHHIEPGQVNLTDFSPVWENGELTKVVYQVRNPGELQQEYEVTLYVNGEEITSRSGYLNPGERSERTLSSGFYDSLYSATSGGSVDVRLVVDYRDKTVGETVTKTFEGSSAAISSVSTSFYGNYGSDTSDMGGLSFTVRNTGDTIIEYDAISVTIAGTTATESKYSAVTLQPGAGTTEYLSFVGDLTVPNGQHSMTIELVRNGEVVAETTVTVSTD